jgi:hypothetical protein
MRVPAFRSRHCRSERFRKDEPSRGGLLSGHLPLVPRSPGLRTCEAWRRHFPDRRYDRGAGRGVEDRGGVPEEHTPQEGRGERCRGFLDILLSLVRPGYLAALQRCRVAVAQRNGALRNAASSDELQPWTDELVSAGISVMSARAEWAAERADGFSRYHEAISGGPGARLEYRSSVGAPAPETNGSTWEERFREALASAEERERQQGRTLVGPHRDDLDLSAAVADDGGTRETAGKDPRGPSQG